MPAERYFYDGNLEGNISLVDQEARHLVTVMRAQIGDRVEVVDGRGTLAQAEISAIAKRGPVTLSVVETSSEPLPADQPTLYQAIPRMNRLDTIIEKVTELGVGEIVLFPGERSERSKLSPSQEKRLRSVAIAAMKQCGRLHLPVVRIAAPIVEWSEVPHPLLFGDLDPAAPPLLSLPSNSSAGFVVGPESGLSDRELERLKTLGAKGVSLHGNILRTDTAAIVAVALLVAPRGQS